MPTRPADLIRARSVDWQTVTSSNVHSALFNESEGGDFYVRFLRSGPDDIYIYPERDPGEWDDFRTAMSKGAWIWNNPIEEGWPYDLLTTRAYPDPAEADLHPDVRRFLQ
jgi:hypothetical protein